MLILIFGVILVSQCLDTPGLFGGEPENTRPNSESRSWKTHRWLCFHVPICRKWLSTPCAIIGDIRGWYSIDVLASKLNVAWSYRLVRMHRLYSQSQCNISCICSSNFILGETDFTLLENWTWLLSHIVRVVCLHVPNKREDSTFSGCTCFILLSSELVGGYWSAHVCLQKRVHPNGRLSHWCFWGI